MRRAIWLILVCAGCASTGQAVERAQIKTAADTCDGKASAIIEAGETCDTIVVALKKLVANDPACKSVFHGTNPDLVCQGLGVQPRAVKQ